MCSFTDMLRSIPNTCQDTSSFLLPRGHVVPDVWHDLEVYPLRFPPPAFIEQPIIDIVRFPARLVSPGGQQDRLVQPSDGLANSVHIIPAHIERSDHGKVTRGLGQELSCLLTFNLVCCS